MVRRYSNSPSFGFIPYQNDPNKLLTFDLIIKRSISRVLSFTMSGAIRRFPLHSSLWNFHSFLWKQKETIHHQNNIIFPKNFVPRLYNDNQKVSLCLSFSPWEVRKPVRNPMVALKHCRGLNLCLAMFPLSCAHVCTHTGHKMSAHQKTSSANKFSFKNIFSTYFIHVF